MKQSAHIITTAAKHIGLRLAIAGSAAGLIIFASAIEIQRGNGAAIRESVYSTIKGFFQQKTRSQLAP